jgi:hypothetical protein
MGRVEWYIVSLRAGRAVPVSAGRASRGLRWRTSSARRSGVVIAPSGRRTAADDDPGFERPSQIMAAILDAGGRQARNSTLRFISVAIGNQPSTHVGLSTRTDCFATRGLAQ